MTFFLSAEGHTGVVRCLQADTWRIVSAADDKTIKVNSPPPPLLRTI